MRFQEFCDRLAQHWRDAPSFPRQRSLIVLRTIGSTHVLARRLVDDYGREGLVPPATDLVAWEQSSGRGRGEHHWTSPAGLGVYLTLVRPLDAEALPTLPLTVAVWICELMNRYLVGRCRVKWPNDLIVGGRKLGGILIEVTRPVEGHPRLALVGIGVNHGRAVESLGEKDATSLLRELDDGPSLPRLCRELAGAVDAGLESDPAEILERYRRLSLHHRGDRLRCRVGGDIVEGVFRGFDPHGFLRLEVAGGERLLPAGEVLSDG